MRSNYLIRFVFIVAIVPALEAQELGTFAASNRLHGKGARNFYGGGASLGGFWRERTATVRVGIRVSVLALSMTGQDPRLACEPPYGCPPVQLRLLTPQAAVIAQPYRTLSTRLEIAGGLASHLVYIRSSRISDEWGFSAGAGVSRRLHASLPLWMHVTYERHFNPLHPRPAFTALPDMLYGTFRVGLLYDFR